MELILTVTSNQTAICELMGLSKAPFRLPAKWLSAPLEESDVKAHIKVTELLSLKANAVVSGDILTNKLAIEPGAVFTGACKMGNQGSVNGKPEPTTETEAK